MGSNVKMKLKIGAILGVMVTIVIILISEILFPEIFKILEAKTLDLRYRTKIENLYHQRNGATIDDIIIIDVDNRSLEKLDRFDQWPRDFHAEVIDYVDSCGASVIGFDVLFMEKDVNQAADNMLLAATKKAGTVCYAMSFSSAEPDAFLYKMDEPPAGFNAAQFSFFFDETVSKNFLNVDRFDGKFSELYNASNKIGFANFQPDDDGIIRKMPLFMNFAGRQYPSLAMSIMLYLLNLEQAQIKVELGREITLINDNEEVTRIPIDKQCRMLINYKGTYQTFRYISYYDVYAKRVPPEFFTDRIVLIGASAAGLYDLRSVPFQNTFPGVEINANIVHNILTQDFIHKNPKIISIIILLALTFLVAIISVFPRLYISIPLTLIIMVVFIFFTFYSFNNNNLWLENVKPVMAMMLSLLAVVAYRYKDAQKDKKRIKGMFQHYLSTSVVNELLKNPGMLELGGERKQATAFFSDIKDFTTYSEMLAPEELVSILNEHLAAMTEIVLKYEGYLDKYEGDAIVAILGIPIEQDDHALRACHAALDMQDILVKLREKWRKENRPLFEVRIGINSGSMIAGNIGGKNRFDYTAIGDSVNLASRLEGANKMYGTDIIISENTFKEVNGDVWVRELDYIRVKGKTEPVRIYELLGRKSQQIDPVRSSSLEYFVQGLELYRTRDWVKAYDYFQKTLQLIPNDGPSMEFIRRCKIFIEHPMSEDWDGVFEMLSK